MFLIAGPCVIEDEELTLQIAERLAQITDDLGIDFYFKASYDKANRTSIHSYRGPGLDEGLNILSAIKHKLGVKILTDVHEARDCETVAAVADVLQIPAMLCRQTDLIVAAGKTGKTVNIKKGQFIAPQNIADITQKIGHMNFWVTERGTCFGYDYLIVDFRLFYCGRGKTVYDVSHSSKYSKYIPRLARAGVAAGIDGLFLEVHPSPERALCDGKTSLKLEDVKPLLESLLRIERAVFRLCLRVY